MLSIDSGGWRGIICGSFLKGVYEKSTKPGAKFILKLTVTEDIIKKEIPLLYSKKRQRFSGNNEYGIISKDSEKVRNCRFLNLRKSCSNPPLKVGNVKLVSTGNFFGNSTWRKVGVNLALFFLKNGLKIPHKTGWHKTLETKKCLQYQHFSHVTRQNQML